jgi:DNA-binding NarL/FixJ family response regulator
MKNHMTSILRELAVNDRTQAVLLATRRLDQDAEG